MSGGFRPSEQIFPETNRWVPLINADITVTNLEDGELEALSFALKEHGFVYF